MTHFCKKEVHIQKIRQNDKIRRGLLCNLYNAKKMITLQYKTFKGLGELLF